MCVIVVGDEAFYWILLKHQQNPCILILSLFVPVAERSDPIQGYPTGTLSWRYLNQQLSSAGIHLTAEVFSAQRPATFHKIALFLDVIWLHVFFKAIAAAVFLSKNINNTKDCVTAEGMVPRENKRMYVHEVVADLSVYKETGYSADCFNQMFYFYVCSKCDVQLGNYAIWAEPIYIYIYIHMNITI